MGIIGIAANPASGKDIRRLTSNASVFDNNEKTNIIQRILLTVAAMGGHKVYLMPDRYNFAARLVRKSEQNSEKLPPNLFEPLDMPARETSEDTTLFAQEMARLGADALIVLGGDGTCRATAKGCGDLPLIPVSTGTNNAFPVMCEGTAVGMAAAALAGGFSDSNLCTMREKRIEIWRNGVLEDIALVDAVFTRQLYGGTKAVWNPIDITQVVVTSCHPARIGFSALPGSCIVVTRQEDAGAVAEAHKGTARSVALSAGSVERIHVGDVRRLPLNTPLTIQPKYDGMIALDGEKEIGFCSGDTLTLYVRRNGPRTVDIPAALEQALQKGFYQM